jgi:hypothetical protein
MLATLAGDDHCEASPPHSGGWFGFHCFPNSARHFICRQWLASLRLELPTRSHLDWSGLICLKIKSPAQDTSVPASFFQHRL